MKYIGLLLTVVLTIASTQIVLTIASTQAAQCTSKEIAAADEQANRLNVDTVCASVTPLMANGSVLDEIMDKVCADKPCMSAIASLFEIQPLCRAPSGFYYSTKNATKYVGYLDECKRMGLVDVEPSPAASAPTPSPIASQAAQCTTEEIAAADEQANRLDVETACAFIKPLLLGPWTKNPWDQICGDKTCMSAIALLKSIQPVCKVSEFYYTTKDSTMYISYLGTCKQRGLVDVGPSPTTSPTASAPVTGIASSATMATVATSAVTLAVLAGLAPQ